MKKVFVCLAVFPAVLFFSCQNFLSGNNLRTNLSSTIGEESSEKITVRVTCQSKVGTTIPSGDVDFSLGYPKEISFVPVSGFEDEYVFKGWRCVKKNTSEPLRKTVIFEDAIEFSTTAALCDVKEDVQIEPVIFERSKVVSTLPVNNTLTETCFNSVLTVVFNNNVRDSLSIVKDLTSGELNTDTIDIYTANRTYIGSAEQEYDYEKRKSYTNNFLGKFDGSGKTLYLYPKYGVWPFGEEKTKETVVVQVKKENKEENTGFVDVHGETLLNDFYYCVAYNKDLEDNLAPAIVTKNLTVDGLEKSASYTEGAPCIFKYVSYGSYNTSQSPININNILGTSTSMGVFYVIKTQDEDPDNAVLTVNVQCADLIKLGNGNIERVGGGVKTIGYSIKEMWYRTTGNGEDKYIITGDKGLPGSYQTEFEYKPGYYYKCYDTAAGSYNLTQKTLKDENSIVTCSFDIPLKYLSNCKEGYEYNSYVIHIYAVDLSNNSNKDILNKTTDYGSEKLKSAEENDNTCVLLPFTRY